MVSTELSTEKYRKHLFLYSIFLALLFLCFLLYIFWESKYFSDQNSPNVIIESYPMVVHFERYLKKFGKSYKGEEFYRRFKNFKASLKQIEILKSLKNHPESARYGLTKFSDMSPEEFEQKMMMKLSIPECHSKTLTCHSDYGNSTVITEKTDIPAKFDWRDHRVVGPVLDQELCMSCWAFSVVGVMESMLVITKQTNKFRRLSVQELTDCSNFTSKCDHGSAILALEFLCRYQFAIVPENKYPLTNQRENCNFNEDPKSGVFVKNFKAQCDVSPKDIMLLVANHGPVTTVVNSMPWQNYLGRVIEFHCDGSWEYMKHVVQIVGYDTTTEIPHFIVRNSWGKDFGDGGYVYIAMENFTCGIGRQITYFDVYQK